jgi:hypothetical protein
MDHDWQTELAALTHMGVSALRGKYAELFGEPTRTGNKTWLVRRIAWRLQALAQGDLSPSLSAVARAVTGSHCNGYLFFRLNGKGVAS